MNFLPAEGTRRNIVRLMQDGDLVIVYERHDCMDFIFFKSGDVFQNRFGAFPHDDVIGKPFGSKIYGKNSSKFVYFLAPTPELWSNALNTRTQIVNELDSSFIVLNLDLFPGCRVIESGTGSGCMSLSLARAVSPNGHIYTYEYNQMRADAARTEFQKFGIDPLITVKCGNVCAKLECGGGFPGVENHSIDAVFLDLPQPWIALDYIMPLLRPSRPVCCYSPCMEQVIKTCEKLRELKFYNIRMFEIRQKNMDARGIALENVDLGHENHYEDSPESYSTEGIQSYYKMVEEDSNYKKRKREEMSKEGLSDIDINHFLHSTLGSRTLNKPKELEPSKIVLGRVETTMKTHTAYLTFAMRPLDSSAES